MIDEMTGCIVMDSDNERRLDELYEAMCEHSYDKFIIQEFGVSDDGSVEYCVFDEKMPSNQYQYFIDLGMLMARIDMCGVDAVAKDILADLASGLGRTLYVHCEGD